MVYIVYTISYFQRDQQPLALQPSSVTLYSITLCEVSVIHCSAPYVQDLQPDNASFT
jgi:hypothetical protein